LATVSVPVRALASAAAATVKLNVPGPVADAPPVAVTHDTSDRAVQAQLLAVVTLIDPAPPAGPVVTDVEDKANVQEAGEG
jgi:hypothetical protein